MQIKIRDKNLKKRSTSSVKGFLKPKELIEKITSYFKIGSSEASTYIDILNKKDLTNILNEMGVDDKEKKKLLK